MQRSEWYVVSPVDGAVVVEVAWSAWEAEQKARKRPGFDVEDKLQIMHKDTPAAPAMRSGKAAAYTRHFLEAHKDWKREEP